MLEIRPFPDIKKHDISSVNNRVNLSTLLHLTNQSMIPESGIMEWQHQRYVSRLCRPFPLPSPPLSSLHSPTFAVSPLSPLVQSLVSGYSFNLYSKACFLFWMSWISFAAKQSWTTLRMRRPLFVGSYMQVTWWALSQWKWRKINNNN